MSPVSFQELGVQDFLASGELVCPLETFPSVVGKVKGGYGTF